jgi:uncharacterized protein (DUF1697 family)
VVYVALVRGINLGARNRLAMADLRRVVEDAGGTEVQTYLQSGNAVFRSSAGRSKLASSLARGLRSLGLDVRVLVRTPKELAKLVDGNPFARPDRDPLTLHATFLAETPERVRVRQLTAAAGGVAPDELRVVGSAVYLHCPNGYGRSKLSNAFIEKQLAVAATTRNWRTVTALADLAARLAV